MGCPLLEGNYWKSYMNLSFESHKLNGIIIPSSIKHKTIKSLQEKVLRVPWFSVFRVFLVCSSFAVASMASSVPPPNSTLELRCPDASSSAQDLRDVLLN